MQDFEKYGVFEAQQALEKMHRQEEDELYRQIFEERQRKVRGQWRLNPHWTHTRKRNTTCTRKWNLLLRMGVFTLDASDIKGIGRKFACSRPAWIGPKKQGFS